MNELDNLRQEAETLKNTIRVSEMIAMIMMNGLIFLMLIHFRKFIYEFFNCNYKLQLILGVVN